jgi:hypothetical protein
MWLIRYVKHSARNHSRRRYLAGSSNIARDIQRASDIQSGFRIGLADADVPVGFSYEERALTGILRMPQDV